MAVCIEGAVDLIQSRVRARQVNRSGRLAGRDGLQSGSVHRGRQTASELCDGRKLPGRMDVIDVVGKSLAER